MRAATRCAVVVVAAAAAVIPALPGYADDVRDAEWHLDALAVAQAHEHSLGEGVTVAVLDSGVDASHPDLRGAVLPGVDLTGRGSDGRDDPAGSGTALAGLIAGRGHPAPDDPGAGDQPAAPGGGSDPDGSSPGSSPEDPTSDQDSQPDPEPGRESDPESDSESPTESDPDSDREPATGPEPTTGPGGAADPAAGGPDGVLGLAPAAAVLPVVVVEPGAVPEPDTLVAGLAEAVRRGADVICLGRPVPDDPAVTQALGAAVTAGAVVVVPGRPAGDALARYGGSGLLGAVAADSAGPVDSGAGTADATAPPGTVVVPAAGTMSTGGQGGYFRFGRTGDAAASAVLAGAAALVRAAYPEATSYEVVSRLMTATDGSLDLIAALTAPPATPTPSAAPALPEPEANAVPEATATDYVAAFDSGDWRRWVVATPLVVFLLAFIVGSTMATRRVRR